jgi:hypothetical protein
MPPTKIQEILRELIDEAPYQIRSIQVDGGSEFMMKFEEACRELGIPLVVLPPASPKYNGGVESYLRKYGGTTHIDHIMG